MTQWSETKRGEAAWKEHLEAISTRNAETRKRAKAAQKSRDGEMAAKRRADAKREAEEIRELNARVAKLRGRKSG